MIYLDHQEFLHLAERALGAPAAVRDHGLIESALARPQASAFGEDAYPTLEEKAAALWQSLARNHALVDGNKRSALVATIVFLGCNGTRLTLTNEEAFDLAIAVATGEIDDVPAIGAVLADHTEPRATW